MRNFSRLQYQPCTRSHRDEILTTPQKCQREEYRPDSSRHAYRPQNPKIPHVALVPSPPEHDTSGLNPQYTFKTYVVEKNNRFAYAASYAVADSPAEDYNPLFLYGSGGLGKTHLLNAIGHAIVNGNRPGFRKVRYVTFERFMQDLIDALCSDSIQQFHENYRNLDLLLIDDIQGIAGKEYAQEELYHTFNALYNAQKQIVVASDRPPKKIPFLEARLRSRFEWGLLADIHPPDPGT